MSCQIRYTNRTAVVPQRGMIKERDLVAQGRETDVADPTSTLVKHVADRIFKPAVPLGMVNHGQSAFAVPVCPANVIQKFAGRTSAQGRSRENTVFRLEMRTVYAVEGKGQFIRA